MNHVTFLPDRLGARQVKRAIGELRAGVGVLFDAPRAPEWEGSAPASRIMALAVESATAASLTEFLSATQGGVVLALTGARASALQNSVQPPAHGLASPLCALTDAAVLCLHLDREHPDLALWKTLAGLGGGAVMAHAAVASVFQETAPAAVQLAKLAALLPALLLAAYDESRAQEGDFLQVTPGCVFSYPSESAASLVKTAEADVPLAGAGSARFAAFRPKDGGAEHIAVLIGAPDQHAAPLVRVHSACLTGDIFGSRRCDCGPQLHQAMDRMAAEGAGVLLYMAQEGRGIGLVNKLRAYRLQDGDGHVPGLDTLDANRALGFGGDERDFAAAAAMLHALGVKRVRLLTNNPEKVAALTARGIEVVSRVSHAIAANGVNDLYLETKIRRFGHLL